MSFIIASAAFFKVCTCNGHGHIVFSDGSHGREVYSIAASIEELNQAQSQGKLTEEEIPELRRQILNSALSSKNEDAGIREKLCAVVINFCGEEADLDGFCEAAEKPTYIN